jgi:hypothetical protein
MDRFEKIKYPNTPTRGFNLWKCSKPHLSIEDQFDCTYVLYLCKHLKVNRLGLFRQGLGPLPITVLVSGRAFGRKNYAPKKYDDEELAMNRAGWRRVILKSNPL